MSITSGFDPSKNGWYFENWGESSEFSWDLYRETYLGINPTQNSVQAPADCAYYEIFKNCAQKGNCGGMSLMGLALFKYGGHMGFCSPACFYPGGVGPDRPDLHEALNILQARQFSAPGVENFLDMVNSGNLNNAEAAFNQVKAQLSNGDYAVLSIANSEFGDAAHTVIPYEIEQQAGTKIMYLWDPNYPYDTFASYYDNRNNRLVINSATDWEYAQGAGTTQVGTTYRGANNGWCFAVPMSLVLRKARQPLAVDILVEGLVTFFVSGPGAAVTQIEDEQGHRFYTSDADVHLRRDEIETHPARKLKDIGRWPWYGPVPQRGEPGALPGELYFMRRPVGSPPLTLTVRGAEYKLMHAQAGNLVEIEARSDQRARDTIRIAGLATAAQCLEIQTGGEGRAFHVRQLRTWAKGAGWRSIHIRNARLTDDNLKVQTIGDLNAVEVSSLKSQIGFELDLRQYREAALSSQSVGKCSTVLGQVLRFAPEDWSQLEHTRIDARTFTRG